MKAKWEYYKIDEAKVNEIQEKYNINKLLATIITNRESWLHTCRDIEHCCY